MFSLDSKSKAFNPCHSGNKRQNHIILGALLSKIEYWASERYFSW